MREGHREQFSRAQARAAAPGADASPSPIVRAPEHPLPWSAVMGARALFPLRLSGLQGAAALPGVAAPTLFAARQDRETRLAGPRSCGAMHPIAFGGGNMRLSRTAKSGVLRSGENSGCCAAAIGGSGGRGLHPSRFSSELRAGRHFGQVLRSPDIKANSCDGMVDPAPKNFGRVAKAQCFRRLAEKTWRQNAHAWRGTVVEAALAACGKLNAAGREITPEAQLSAFAAPCVASSPRRVVSLPPGENRATRLTASENFPDSAPSSYLNLGRSTGVNDGDARDRRGGRVASAALCGAGGGRAVRAPEKKAQAQAQATPATKAKATLAALPASSRPVCQIPQWYTPGVTKLSGGAALSDRAKLPCSRKQLQRQNRPADTQPAGTQRNHQCLYLEN
jgi:hypothetical protein